MTGPGTSDNGAVGPLSLKIAYSRSASVEIGVFDQGMKHTAGLCGSEWGLSRLI